VRPPRRDRGDPSVVAFFWAVVDRRRVARAAKATDEEAAPAGTTTAVAPDAAVVPVRQRVISGEEGATAGAPAASLGGGAGFEAREALDLGRVDFEPM
jgi:hypothetical protein